MVHYELYNWIFRPELSGIGCSKRSDDLLTTVVTMTAERTIMFLERLTIPITDTQRGHSNSRIITLITIAMELRMVNSYVNCQFVNHQLSVAFHFFGGFGE